MKVVVRVADRFHKDLYSDEGGQEDGGDENYSLDLEV